MALCLNITENHLCCYLLVVEFAPVNKACLNAFPNAVLLLMLQNNFCVVIGIVQHDGDKKLEQDISNMT